MEIFLWAPHGSKFSEKLTELKRQSGDGPGSKTKTLGLHPSSDCVVIFKMNGICFPSDMTCN